MKTEFKVKDKKVRCGWCLSSDLMVKYHDEEWGNPVHNDRKHFEFILLDGFQAGLSWSTIINKRKNFKKAFDYLMTKVLFGINLRSIHR